TAIAWVGPARSADSTSEVNRLTWPSKTRRAAPQPPVARKRAQLRPTPCRFAARAAKPRTIPSRPRCKQRKGPELVPPGSSRQQWRDESRKPTRGRWPPDASRPRGRAALARSRMARGKSLLPILQSLPVAYHWAQLREIQN